MEHMVMPQSRSICNYIFFTFDYKPLSRQRRYYIKITTIKFINMDMNKKSYHFNITEVIDGKIREVMNFNFGGHHDLADMLTKLEQTNQMREKHCKELVVGLRLLHHVIKKYPDNEAIKKFRPAFEDFMQEFRPCMCKEG